MSTSTDSPRKQDARLSGRIREFFYREEVPYSLAVVRIFMPVVLLWVMLPRWFNARELYSTDGAPTPLGLLYGFADLLPMFSGEVVVALHSVLILALIAASLGWCTRLSLALSTGLYIYLNMLDSVSTITKYSVIASHVMLLLTLSHCGAVWSVDRWLANRRRQRQAALPGETAFVQQKFPVWPQRLMQLMIGLVYFGAAVTKMHTPEFFSGDQMTYWMLSHVNYENPGGEVLSQYPSLIVASAYITIVWEMTFLFLAWRGWGRLLMISLGLVFHVMTNITLGLFIFPLVCSTIYFAFLGEEDFRKLAVRFGRLQTRWNLPEWGGKAMPAAVPVPQRSLRWSWAAYGLALIITAAGGLMIERVRDPYGIRRPEGRYTLKEISPEVVHQWLAKSEPIREEDKLFAFDLGTITVGDSLANRRKVFKHGQNLIAQVNLNPPHEDMYIECNLHDAEGRLMMRLPRAVPSSRFREHFHYALDASLPPNEYQIVLNFAGQEVSRRTFRLLAADAKPNPRAVSAN